MSRRDPHNYCGQEISDLEDERDALQKRVEEQAAQSASLREALMKCQDAMISVEMEQPESYFSKEWRDGRSKAATALSQPNPGAEKSSCNDATHLAAMKVALAWVAYRDPAIEPGREYATIAPLREALWATTDEFQAACLKGVE